LHDKQSDDLNDVERELDKLMTSLKDNTLGMKEPYSSKRDHYEASRATPPPKISYIYEKEIEHAQPRSRQHSSGTAAPNYSSRRNDRLADYKKSRLKGWDTAHYRDELLIDEHSAWVKDFSLKRSYL
jgi:hypothetical protein